MVRRIVITAGEVTVLAELNETETAHAVWDRLPIEGVASTWGDEIYFSTTLSLGLEAGQEVVEAGDLGYWPPGKALCLFFGPTPASRGDEIRAASPVTIFGWVVGDATVLTAVKDGATVTVRRSQD
ncbi:MAG: cyclophilin-like fold protein [Anaerolineae bacterium]|nr:cyclophilin-like fold protein [Anaerolineae bacterium]